jgi:ubiquinone/menaquinone biosynthesis C-methylase UbiE
MPSVRETHEQMTQRIQSELSQLHQKYKTMNSVNLHNEFAADPEQWTKYHEINEENEKSFLEEDIPRNQIIRILNTYKTKRTKTIVDLGCGKAQIYEHFKDDKRFNIISYDHVSCATHVTKCDIQSTPLEDDSVEICILSLAMWGSNCKTYIKEAHRILESGGMLYIIEPTKRWTDFDEQGNVQSTESNKLRDLLQENGFNIISTNINKFSLISAMK